MTFIEAIKNIINSEWFQAASAVIYPIVSGIFVILVNVLKKRLTTVTTNTDANISEIFSKFETVKKESSDANSNITEMKKQNEELKIAVTNITIISTSLLKVLSSVYMQSKAVDKETKELIGKVMYDAKSLGLKVEDTIIELEQKSIKETEVISKIVETKQEEISENIAVSAEQAKDTEQEALSLYNNLIEQVGTDE